MKILKHVCAEIFSPSRDVATPGLGVSQRALTPCISKRVSTGGVPSPPDTLHLGTLVPGVARRLPPARCVWGRLCLWLVSASLASLPTFGDVCPWAVSASPLPTRRAADTQDGGGSRDQMGTRSRGQNCTGGGLRACAPPIASGVATHARGRGLGLLGSGPLSAPAQDWPRRRRST